MTYSKARQGGSNAAFKFGIAAAIILGFTTFTASAQAKADAARGQQIATTVCAACHGADGNSLASANPHLAGQGEQYIASQLAAFKAGTRVNAVMQGMAANLTPEDMKAVGAYFAAQKLTKPAAARDKKLAEEGQQIYRAGVRKIDVPACAGCHGANGSGIPAQYPRLAGQWPEYTLQNLDEYAKGTRKHPIMATITQRLSDRQMKALAEYIAGMR
jgi:cytochrome c553